MSFQVMKAEVVKYVEPKVKQPLQWLRSFFIKKVEKPVEVWEEAFPWP
jgi:hypothetical protein